MFTPPSAFTATAFVLLCLGIVCAFLSGIWVSAGREGVDPRKRTARIAVAAVLWISLTSVPAWTGWTEARPMPRLLFVLAFINLASLAVGLSRIGRWLAESVSLGLLVGFQAFRLPLELILHSWAQAGVIPETMTWSGSNWDVFTGITALILAPFARRRAALAWIANIVGIALLMNVGRVVVLSSPLPFAWQVVPSLQLAFHVPFAWILPICVGGAIIGHVVLTRALLRGGKFL